ncbi:MAG: rod-binding protein [Rhodospirillaceae bacterium]|nr:rod-binding protein [Rhodospirillaceae bacterium]
MASISLIGQNAFSTALAKQTQASSANLSTADQKKIKKAAQDFEGFFVGQMMESMTEGLETNEYFGGGHGEEMWRSMLNQEYGKEVAKGGKLGIASTVMASMLRAQEERTKAQMQGAQPQAAAPATNLGAADPTTVNAGAAAVLAGAATRPSEGN